MLFSKRRMEFSEKMDNLIKSARLDEDGTLWIELNEQDMAEVLDKINRVIVTSGVWCKMFYLEDTPIECNDK